LILALVDGVEIRIIKAIEALHACGKAGAAAGGSGERSVIAPERATP
jgi:hypothetical protein